MSNEALCLEILGVLRRCFSQPAGKISFKPNFGLETSNIVLIKTNITVEIPKMDKSRIQRCKSIQSLNVEFLNAIRVPDLH